MKCLLAFIFWFFSVMVTFGQCDKLVKNEYDKFEKTSKVITIKNLEINQSGYNFKIIPKKNWVANGYSYYSMDIEVINQISNKPASIGNQAQVIFLFENDETLIRYNRDIASEDFPNSIGLIHFRFGPQVSTYVPNSDELVQRQLLMMKTLKVTAIRIKGIEFNEKIDINLSTEHQEYFKQIFNCFQKLILPFMIANKDQYYLQKEKFTKIFDKSHTIEDEHLRMYYSAAYNNLKTYFNYVDKSFIFIRYKDGFEKSLEEISAAIAAFKRGDLESLKTASLLSLDALDLARK